MANNSETFTVQNNLVGNNNFAMISDSPEQRGESGERAVTPTEDSPPPYLAVLVKDAVKSYSSGEAVIKNMNMNVPIGSIYGLLGASGCGKTTILSCIVGLRHLTSGTIKVFGKNPGTVDGRCIGFMPQESALYDYFNIKEILQYYGQLYGMTASEIQSKTEFLCEFLDLPGRNALVKTLSGGQKRRLSLAVSIIHTPALLILDEPTVGVDALLANGIWEHLEHIAKTFKTTIIVTTHYIEEAKRSATVGIMRNGRLLVEKSPQTLLDEYQTIYLEQVFLQLCAKDVGDGDLKLVSSESLTKITAKGNLDLPTNEDSAGIKVLSFKKSMEDLTEVQPNEPDVIEIPNQKHDNRSESFFYSLSIIQALILKYFTFLYRTPWYTFLVVLVVPMQIANFIFLVGHDPKHVALGMVNNEIRNQPDILSFCKALSSKDHCNINKLSCRFIQKFPDDEVNWKFYDSEAEAVEAVGQGLIWGYLQIPENYTEFMTERAAFNKFSTNETLIGSTITGRLDAAYKLKADYIVKTSLDHLTEFLKDSAEVCNQSSKAMETPLKFNVIYGSLGPTYSEFMQTGFLLLAVVLVPMASGLHLIWEKNSGSLPRAMVAGLKFWQLVVALIICESIMLTLQIGLTFGVMFMGGFVMNGSLPLFFLLVFLCGSFGILVGLFFGIAFDTPLNAIFMAVAVHFVNINSCGGVWPIESAGRTAVFFYSKLPFTLPIIAARSIASRGWGLLNPHVLTGFGTIIIWLLFLVICCCIAKKMKKS